MCFAAALWPGKQERSSACRSRAEPAWCRSPAHRGDAQLWKESRGRISGASNPEEPALLLEGSEKVESPVMALCWATKWSSSSIWASSCFQLLPFLFYISPGEVVGLVSRITSCFF